MDIFKQWIDQQADLIMMGMAFILLALVVKWLFNQFEK